MPRRLIPAAFALAILAACSGHDARLDKLHAGMSKDSVLMTMGVEQPARLDPYLTGGHYIEALYYAKPGADAAKTPDRKMSPVIVIDGKLVGFGWKYWDSVAGANRIIVAK